MQFHFQWQAHGVARGCVALTFQVVCDFFSAQVLNAPHDGIKKKENEVLRLKTVYLNHTYLLATNPEEEKKGRQKRLGACERSSQRSIPP